MTASQKGRAAKSLHCLHQLQSIGNALCNHGRYSYWRKRCGYPRAQVAASALGVPAGGFPACVRGPAGFAAGGYNPVLLVVARVAPV